MIFEYYELTLEELKTSIFDILFLGTASIDFNGLTFFIFLYHYLLLDRSPSCIHPMHLNEFLCLLINFYYL